MNFLSMLYERSNDQTIMISPQGAQAINRKHVQMRTDRKNRAKKSIIKGIKSVKKEILDTFNGHIRNQSECKTKVKKWVVSVVIRLQWSGLYTSYDADDDMIMDQILKILTGWISEYGWNISNEHVHYRSQNFALGGISVVIKWDTGNKSIDRGYEFECVLTAPETPETPGGP